MRQKQISTDALAVLSECLVVGSSVHLPAGQLERKLYQEVDLVLKGIGGKWNGGKRSHLFAEPQSEVEEMLEGCLQTGLAIPLSRNGYFPTQSEIAIRVAFLAGVRNGMKALEPSAGTGNLIQALMTAAGPGDINSLDAIENDSKLYAQLVARFGDQSWFHPYPCSFLEWQPGPSYDRVIMNPPFGCGNGQALQDIDHVMHAWDLLIPGGRLVSIMSWSVTFRREKKAVEFREHVDRFGRIEELPEGAFKKSGTLTRTIIAVLDKPKGAANVSR